MKRFKSHARKVVVALIGFPIILIGIVLIPLPGPGFLVIIAGLAILALEFEWAERHMNNLKQKVSQVTDKIRSTKNKKIGKNDS